jgi:hypothetical protein
MAEYIVGAVVVLLIMVGPCIHGYQKRRRARRGPFVPLAPGALPTGKNRGPRFQVLIEVEGFDDRANEGLVERGVEHALRSAAGGVFYDTSSVEVLKCRQLPVSEERPAALTATAQNSTSDASDRTC